MNDRDAPTACLYGQRARRQRSSTQSDCQPTWTDRLPAEWRDRVVPPSGFRVYREHEIPARRVLGFDGAGALCFCAHDYRLVEPRSDDDEDFYQALAYGESVAAWRLLGQGWLVHRSIAPEGDDGVAESHLSLQPQAPR